MRAIYSSSRAKGFTLVEIMIVVAIIALIAAIAIPNLLRARHNANETAAIGNLRTLVDGLEEFRSNMAPTSYPGAGVTVGLGGPAATSLADLAVLNPPYFDTVLGSGTRQGYTFTYVPNGQRNVVIAGNNFTVYDGYTILARPITLNITGTRRFFVDQSGVIRANATADATANDVPLE
ncbi:MAG: prepilin-type N-terminal cleavage/methylation domain-containing protein [Candidatus Omnitrophica bacterium]|nr:prepilin-type N-terminal cleavage/methylation domain-containing protein [Candidatus Omnitrophota bacterium]